MGHERRLRDDARDAGFPGGDHLMRISPRIFSCLAIALASGSATAAKLFVTATVMPTCKLSVSVPKVGSEARTQAGTASFSAICTHVAKVSSDPDGAMPAAIAPSMPSAEVRMTKGIVPHPNLDAFARVADYGDMRVAEVLF